MKKSKKVLLGLLIASSTILPCMANSTDITIQSEVEDVISLIIERTSDNVTVSDDDLDGMSAVSSNAIVDFGKVNALGIETDPNAVVNTVSRSVAGGATTNGVTGNVTSMVIDNASNLYNVDGSGTPLPKSTHNGAIYVLENALQLRVFRTGLVASSIDVNQSIGSQLRSLVENSSQDFTDGITLGSDSLLPLNGALRNTSNRLSTNLSHNTPLPIDIGIHVPFSVNAQAGLTTKIIFTAI